MLDSLRSLLDQLYSISCGSVGTAACETSLSVACSFPNCLLVPFAGAFLAISLVAGAIVVWKGLEW